ncbi:hypothetical protein niasHT_018471 [Heterodera trifolii]|uniref:F-box domain-containing protein n=1 Tax=Heterodera trifolii TaxID=157864 RepID=A0ABD2KWH0_9BILA
MSDNRKEAEEKMAKAIFISGNGWLAVFDLLEPSQIGLGIALISHRFNIYVDEHFKTRKWTLAFIRIRRKIGENGTNQMEIVNSHAKPMPTAQIRLPREVIGLRFIRITYVDQNAIAFLHRFRPLFAACQIYLTLCTSDDRILELIIHNIWPMLGRNIHGMEFVANGFRRLRQFVPSFLSDCPSLRFVFSGYVSNLFLEFPCDDNAMASDRQALAKWLFTPLQNGVPKVFRCWMDSDEGIFASKLEALKSTFANASSAVNFIVVIWVFPPSFADSVVLFDLINELTHEQLALKIINNSDRLLLIRCPIARDESKWSKWEEEAIRCEIDELWNKIYMQIHDENFASGTLFSTHWTAQMTNSMNLMNE